MTTLTVQSFSDLVELGNKYGKVTKEDNNYVIEFDNSTGFNVLMQKILKDNADVINPELSDLENIEMLLNSAVNPEYDYTYKTVVRK